MSQEPLIASQAALTDPPAAEPVIAYQTSSPSAGGQTLTGIANLIKLLPTGTVFLFQFLNPVITNNGSCQDSNKYMGAILVALCGLSCFFSCFTDSFIDKAGVTHYGIATKTGLWPSTGKDDLSAYKLKPGDFVHALFSMLVFAVIVLLNVDSVRCYYPAFESDQKVLLMVLPPAIGTISGTVFVTFPNNRHGIGYSKTQTPRTKAS